jgi:transcription initiation factor TFIID subunit TAF12
MGLLGGIAKTAVIAGTATGVSNRVSRRQANRWAAQDQQQPQPQQQYEEPQQQYAPPPPPQYPSGPTPDALAQLQQLGELRASGVLTEAEFQVQKERVLAG